MSMHRDFDAMLAEKLGQRPTFTIAGQTFTLRASLPFAKWTKLVAYMVSDSTGDDEMQQTNKFFNTVLIRADRQRFAELVAVGADDNEDDEDLPAIDMSQMPALIDWVMEHFTGKHRSSSASSSPGSSATGQSPNVVSLNARSTAV